MRLLLSYNTVYWHACTLWFTSGVSGVKLLLVFQYIRRDVAQLFAKAFGVVKQQKASQRA